MLLAPYEGSQTPLLDRYVLFYTPPVREELAGCGPLGDDVTDELDAPPPDARGEKLALESSLRVAHDHPLLARDHHNLPSLLGTCKLGQGYSQTLRELRRDNQRRILLTPL